MGNIPFKPEEAKQIADFFVMNMEDIFFSEEVSCGGFIGGENDAFVVERN